MSGFGSESPLELTVSGHTFFISKALASKYPFSRLADLVYEIPVGGRHSLDLDTNAFAVVLQYLEHGNLDEAKSTSTYVLQRTFEALKIPSPSLDAPENDKAHKQRSPNPTMNDEIGHADPPPPAYEECNYQEIGSGKEQPSNLTADRKPSKFALTLPAQLALVRKQRITSLIYTYILQFVAEQGFSGLYRTSCVFVPSNVLVPGDASPTADVIVGFPEDEDVKLIRLSGEENRLEFWRQSAVVSELEATLKEALLAGGHRLAPEQETLPAFNPSPSPEQALSPSRHSTKASWFRRRVDSREVPEEDPTSNSSAGWRAPEQLSRLNAGEIRVQVAFEDICLRVVTDMGLYDNRKGEAIIVRIHIAH
ncbi:MAG: hypothetical protein M1812_000011 [Candelaria pacifica]|nr:MAG: hypothetical protein M1812_000011 [Candelaria pacifica]